MGASGGIGTACVLLAKRVGATVISCASSQAKLDGLAELGSDHGINYVATEMRTAVWDLTGKPRINGEGGVDLLVNCTGGGTWIDSIRCMRRAGGWSPALPPVSRTRSTSATSGRTSTPCWARTAGAAATSSPC